MPTYTDWLAAGNAAIDTETRASDAWGRIQRNPSSVVIVRGKTTTLSVQTVHVGFNDTAGESGGASGSSGKRTVTVYGVKGHPTVADTDIQRDDRFALAGTQYRVVDVITPPGEVQAICEALS